MINQPKYKVYAYSGIDTDYWLCEDHEPVVDLSMRYLYSVGEKLSKQYCARCPQRWPDE